MPHQEAWSAGNGQRDPIDTLNVIRSQDDIAAAPADAAVVVIHMTSGMTLYAEPTERLFLTPTVQDAFAVDQSKRVEEYLFKSAKAMEKGMFYVTLLDGSRAIVRSSQVVALVLRRRDHPALAADVRAQLALREA